HHRQRLTLGLEPRDDLAAVHAQLDDLEGDAPLDRLALLGHPDFAETAFADLLQQLVAAKHLRRGFGRRRRRQRGSGRLYRRLLHEGVLLKMISQQGFHLGPLRPVRAAGAIQEGGAFLRRAPLQRLEKDLLLRVKAGCDWIAHSMSCYLQWRNSSAKHAIAPRFFHQSPNSDHLLLTTPPESPPSARPGQNASAGRRYAGKSPVPR